MPVARKLASPGRGVGWKDWERYFEANPHAFHFVVTELSERHARHGLLPAPSWFPAADDRRMYMFAAFPGLGMEEDPQTLGWWAGKLKELGVLCKVYAESLDNRAHLSDCCMRASADFTSTTFEYGSFKLADGTAVTVQLEISVDNARTRRLTVRLRSKRVRI